MSGVAISDTYTCETHPPTPASVEDAGPGHDGRGGPRGPWEEESGGLGWVSGPDQDSPHDLPWVSVSLSSGEKHLALKWVV